MREWLDQSFNVRLRDGLLDGGILYSLREARIISKSCGHYNANRSHATSVPGTSLQFKRSTTSGRFLSAADIQQAPFNESIL